MSITVNIGEAKTRLSELVAKVEAGEEVVIARGNENDQARRAAIVEAMLRERDDGTRKKVTLKETGVASRRTSLLMTSVAAG
jgi:antitoxin (DNA-binding transcriptional repressor) of toxin-antitoxin stability system